VDPGVGTKRRPLIVETKRGFYVGPDNGLLMLSARKEGLRHVYDISNPEYMRPEVSRTFHGRDIFAPAAAHLAKGHPPSKFGTEIHDYVFPKFAKPQLRKGRLLGEILYIDGFGNIVTNISVRDLERISASEDCLLHVKFKDEILDLRLCSAYGQVPAERALAGLNRILKLIDGCGGKERYFGLYKERNRRIRDGIQNLGLTLFPKEAYESPTVTCINAPNNISGPEIYQRMREKGFELAKGYGSIKEITFRIGNMGYIELEDIELMLEALGEVLSDLH
jgi:Uncharacterized conserved protein